MHERYILEVKKAKVHTKEAPLSHRKRCSWNASSVVSPIILGHYVTSHRVTMSLNWCLAAGLAHENSFSAAALLLLAVLGQACVS